MCATELTLKITDLARGGAGVAREDSGRVIFVPFTVTGDLVRVKLLEENKRYAQGELIEVLEPSPIRQKPPCPVFGRCGGCQWQHIPYGTQWETKTRGVLHALSRLSIEIPGSPDLLPAEEIWNYRNRIQLRGERSEIGFYAAKSHERIAIESCETARKEINQALAEVRQEGAKFEQPYKVEVEVLPNGEIRKSWNARHAAGGFRQVHDQQNEKLRNWVASHIAPDGRVLDLFGGNGNLGGPVSLRSEHVDCVDISAPEGTKNPDYPHLQFHRSETSKWVKKTARAGNPHYDSAVIDPPREGFGDELSIVAPLLEGFGVREIVAVGCDPDSWARDLNRWIRRGWTLQRVGILDLFPQTPHVESLAKLTRPV